MFLCWVFVRYYFLLEMKVVYILSLLFVKCLICGALFCFSTASTATCAKCVIRFASQVSLYVHVITTLSLLLYLAFKWITGCSFPPPGLPSFSKLPSQTRTPIGSILCQLIVNRSFFALIVCQSCFHKVD